ncbi:MAG: DUF2786 domain-containing protein [Candidatus Latescibacteria bacterium]|nr:DUF2786 domain-containing protein [Candidatus Latescibacterota bacterium]
MKHPEVTGALRTAWNRQLYHGWTHYNTIYLSGALQRPLIQIGRSVKELGSWDGARRLLTLSEGHIWQHPWPSVLETLRHEMAHQYVQEVLQVRDEPPHGPAFRQACERLRCSPCPRALPGRLAGADTPQTEEDRTLLKVKKLMALADSPNQNEAQAAMNKAHSLLLKYNLDAVDLDRERQFSTRCLGEVKGRWAPYEYRLASILNEFFFVLVFAAQSYDARKNRSGKMLQIYGAPENLNMAEYVYAYLTGLLDALWVQYRAQAPPRMLRGRQQYFAGVLTGFYQKLRGQAQDLQEQHALVWKGDSRLKAYFKHHNPRTITRYSRGARQTRVYQDGILKGRQITIRQPLQDAGPEPGGYLPEGRSLRSARCTAYPLEEKP